MKKLIGFIAAMVAVGFMLGASPDLVPNGLTLEGLDGGTLNNIKVNGLLSVGDPCTPSHTLSANSLCIDEDLEVNGAVFFDSNVNFYTTVGLGSGIAFYYGSTVPAMTDGLGMRSYNNIDQASLTVGDQAGNQLLLIDDGSRNNDCGLANQSNPTLRGYSSANCTGSTEWWGLVHNGTDPVLSWGKGLLQMDGIASDLSGACTDNQVALDTGGATKELCVCESSTWRCVALGALAD